ncbi:MAG: SDR family oxidoreductase [Thermomicrobiales bacterium]
MTGAEDGGDHRPVAVVTGAGSGVGRATALALAKDGYAVVLLGRTVERLRGVAAEIEAAGGAALPIAADIGVEGDVQTAFGEATRLLGRIDALVCSAGVGLYGPVEQYSLGDWEATIRTNLTGVFLCSRAVLPIMRTQGRGAIVAIGSGAGKQGYATLAAYSASKFGLIGFMQSLAAEVGEHGIKVGTILPGSILSGFAGRSSAEKEAQAGDGRKYLEPADVAQAVRYLLSQPARAWTQELNLWPA